ncbi:unnamed protein product [Cylicocyclus nassatus]|uniref:Uncharacterized protein n=1 Tax=Cylicocyclus nassatus TaxID=53992 RepID=A0AA36GS53_CYLNA|nr:unnamed protein product [Cylicocyclus nassatus]
MALPLIIIAITVIVQACPPRYPYPPMQPIPDPYGGGGYYPGGYTRYSTVHPPGVLPTVRPVRNRKAERILVTVISNLDYDPKLNNARLHASKTWLENTLHSMGVMNKTESIPAQVATISGKFSILYTMDKFDCKEVLEFARAMKNMKVIASIRVKCPKYLKNIDFD